VAHPTADGRSLRRGLRPLALFALVFTVSASGPYGLEETVPTAGPGLAILVLVAMAFVWGAPLPPIFAQLHARYGTPSVFLILQAIFFSIVTYFFDFLEILVVSTWIGLPTYLLMFVTPMILRSKRPDLKGPFRIPGGWPGLLLCAIPPFVISVYVLVTVSPREMLLGLPFFAVGPLLYVWARWSHRPVGAEEGERELD
jgi:amino acid transporter